MEFATMSNTQSAQSPNDPILKELQKLYDLCKQGLQYPDHVKEADLKQAFKRLILKASHSTQTKDKGDESDEDYIQSGFEVPHDPIMKHIQKFSIHANPFKIRKIVKDHLNRENVVPHQLISLGKERGYGTNKILYPLAALQHVEGQPQLKIVGFSSRGAEKLDGTPMIFTYGIYIEFTPVHTLSGEHINNVMGTINASEKKINEVMWGFQKNSNVPTWLIKDEHQTITTTETMLMTINWKAERGWYFNVNKQGYITNTAYPILHLPNKHGIQVVRKDFKDFHFLGHEITGDLFCFYNRLQDVDKPANPLMLHNTIKRLEKSYLPQYNNDNVFALK